ncbi:MAG: phytoene desaturase family protein [Syntrophales bacterium]
MYDAIIIGQDLSALVAALTASRRGLKTVLVNDGDLKNGYQEAGYSFPIDPTPILGAGQEKTIFRLLRERDILPDDAPPLILMDPAFQVILPGHRVDLFHDREQLIRDLIREFPLEVQEIRRFYHAVSKNGELMERWISEDASGPRHGFGRLISQIVRYTQALTSRPSLTIRGNRNFSALRSIMDAQIALLSYLDITGFPFPISVAYLLTSPTRGLFYSAGGRNAWSDWLRKGFRDAGGELIDGCSIMRIDTKPDINVDLECSGTSKTIRGKKLIVSAQWEKLNLLLFQEKIFRRLVNRLESDRPHAHPFSLHMGIREGGIPEKMSPYAVVVPDEKKTARGLNLLFFEMSLPGDTRRAPEGKRAASVTVYLQDSPLVLDDSKLKAIAKTIIDSLDWFLPFLRESIDHIDVERSIAVARHSQEIVNKKYPVGKRSIIAMSNLSPRTPLRNVFLTGGIIRAGLGFEGEILSGMDAASLAEKEL